MIKHIKQSTRELSIYTGLITAIFVVLVGALGYLYVLNYKADVATTPHQTQTITAQTVTVPAIEETDDLDAALQTLDAASVDTLTDADLNALETELENL